MNNDWVKIFDDTLQLQMPKGYCAVTKTIYGMSRGTYSATSVMGSRQFIHRDIESLEEAQKIAVALYELMENN